MSFVLVETEQVTARIADLEQSNPTKHRKVINCLARLGTNPAHPGLASHPYDQIKGPAGERVWESYVENRTPSAWRGWWFYGPDPGEITLVDLGPHP